MLTLLIMGTILDDVTECAAAMLSVSRVLSSGVLGARLGNALLTLRMLSGDKTTTGTWWLLGKMPYSSECNLRKQAFKKGVSWTCQQWSSDTQRVGKV